MGWGALEESARDQVALLERSEFAETLDENLAAVRAGAGRLVLVSGEAGVGKSALVRRFCDAHGERARVLWGACDALGTPRPLSPVIDIAAAVDGPVLASVLAGDKPHAVFVALHEELRSVRPTVAVIEDVHWADEATLDVIRLLARRAEALGSLVVVTYRENELPATHPVRLAVGELGTAPGVTQLRLPPLTRTAVAELSGPYGVDAEELYEKTAGNPFYVTEVLAGGGTDVPPTVRDAVLGRMSRLPAAAQGVLEAVAVVPPHVELWLLDEVVGDEIAHVDACLAAGMLRGEGRTVSFRHELARLAVEQSIGPHRRVVLHRRVLEALLDPAEGAAPDPAQLAHHAEAAGDACAVLEHGEAAALRAAAQGAHREAAAQYARALRFAASLDPEELTALLERYALECYLTNQIDAAVEAQGRVLEYFRELGDARRESRALRALSEMIWCPGRVAESERAARAAVDALAGLEPGSELALAYLNLASLALDAETSIALAARAGAVAELLGDDELALHARVEIDASRYYGDGGRASAERLEETLGLVAEAGLELQITRCWNALAWGATRHRDYDAADRYVEAGLAHCRERDMEMWERYLHGYRARGALDRSRWADATEAAMIILHDQGPSVVPLIVAGVIAGMAAARQGQPQSAELLARAVELADRQRSCYALAMVSVARAEVAWLEGRPEAIPGITEAAFDRAVRERAWVEAGELARWRRRAGRLEVVPEVTGPDAAALAGDWAEAARRWDELGCPYEAALALSDAGDDDDEAVRRGLVELQRLGARPAAAIVTQRLRERGVRRLPRGPYAAARQNPAHLTARELEVLALLAEGLRNAEIAARLVVSRRTIDHHVSALLRKLGASTRGEAAAIAARDGLIA